MELDAKLRADLSRFLPADLLQQLPERNSMRDAIQRLGSLYTNVSSFLPNYIVENEEMLTRDSGQLRPGTFIFADVSGFTALSETLQAKGGSEGVEILTQVINDYFARMLEIIAKSDGQLLKFAGDALLAFFPERENERLDEAEKAIRTGLRMQRSMREFFQPIQNQLLDELIDNHELELTMSIGISRGELFEALVGNTNQRDHIIQGKLPGMAEAAEGVGIRDDVIIDGPLYETFKDTFTMREAGEGFYQVVDDLGDDLGDFEFHIPRRRRGAVGSLFNLIESDPISELQDELHKVQTVACYVAPEVVNKLAITAEHVTAENRPSTVIFSHVSGFSEMLEAWGPGEVERIVRILSRYYTIVQRIIASYGGVLTRTDPYKSGFKMLTTFGAPVAHPDDPQRAVYTALEILRELGKFNERLLEELPEELHLKPFIKQRFGITHGNVFAGEAGWRARREYTVMGDDVNLAARLMSKSEFGDIWLSARAWQRIRDDFVTKTLEPMALKGKSNVIQAYRVVSTKQSTDEIPAMSSTPFIGRDLLMLSLTAMLKRAAEQRMRGAVALVADAGVGKTRTAHQLVRSAESSGFKVAWSSSQIVDDRKTTWSSIIAQLLDMDDLPAETNRTTYFEDQLRTLGLGNVPALMDLMSAYLVDTVRRKSTDEIKIGDKVQTGKNIFDLTGLQEEDERFRTEPTGLFQAVRRHIPPPEIPTTGTGVWDDLERKTSLEEAIMRFLAAYCDKQPTMLVIDDIHDMNMYTLAVVERLFNEIMDKPLVVVTTMEPVDVNLPRELPRLEVSDLTREETLLMAVKIIRASEIGPKLADFLWERSSGRPFYIESLLHSLQINHQVLTTQGIMELREDVDIDALTEDIRELIISRIDRLPTDQQEILRYTAVLDLPFDRQIIMALTGREHEEGVRADFLKLVQGKILERLPDGSYQFIHGVTRRTLYDNLSRYHRQKMHRTVAEYFESLPENERSLIVIAHHHVKAGSVMRALEMISMAASKAEENKDLEGAIELYNRALELVPNDETVKRHLERLLAIKEEKLG